MQYSWSNRSARGEAAAALSGQLPPADADVALNSEAADSDARIANVRKSRSRCSEGSNT